MGSLLLDAPPGASRAPADDRASPDSARQFRLGLATVLAGVAAFLQIYATQPILPELQRAFRATELGVSLTVSALTLAVALASPLVGLLSDTFGRRSVLVPAVFGLGLASMLSATSGTLQTFIVWRFVQGLFVPGIIAVSIAYIAEESAAGTAARVTANYVTGTVAGGLIGRMLAAAIADHFGWRWSFLTIGSLTLICGVLIARLLPASRHFQPTSHPLANMRAMVQHMRNPVLVASYVVGFNVLFSLVGCFTYVNFLLAGPPFRLSTTALGLIFLVYALGLFVTPVGGRLIDRIGHRLALVCATGIVSAGALLTLVPHLVAVIAGLAILSTGIFISQSAASSHVASAATHTRSAATGLYVSFYYLGGAAGATALGWAWRHGGWPACIGLVLGVQLLAATIAYRFFSRPAPKPDPQLTPIEAEIS